MTKNHLSRVKKHVRYLLFLIKKYVMIINWNPILDFQRWQGMLSTCGNEESPIIEQELVAQIVERRWLSENCLFAIFLLSWYFLQLLPSKGWKFWWHWAWWGWQSLKHFCNWGRIQPERHPEGTITCEEATIGDDKKDHTKDVWQWTPDQAQQTDWALQGSRLLY